MTAIDKFGFHFAYSDLILTTSHLKSKKPLLSFHYEEYDGWSYMNGDMRTTVIIEVNKKLTIEDLKLILKSNDFPKNIEVTLKQMIKKKKIVPCSFIDQSFDVKSIRWDS
ncbi:hypothetical protein [Leptospira licerasiae]|uniref:hypothetical protein n=1 Tax=Leptospira licerasiae TaxID=447106 RepID=UPI00301A407E